MKNGKMKVWIDHDKYKGMWVALDEKESIVAVYIGELSHSDGEEVRLDTQLKMLELL